MQLSNQQKELLLDYGLGIASESQASQARQLIESNPEASALYNTIRSAIFPLEHIETHECPEYLAERTIARLKEAATCERIPAMGRPHGPTGVLFGNLARVAAVAAIVLVGVGIGLPALGLARNIATRYRCQWQLSRVYQGLDQYMADSQGRMPAVAIPEGAPWWKIGYQGRENHSNTRSAWLLVKGGYAPVQAFWCPGADRMPASRCIVPTDYNDFPTRDHVRYSFRLCCERLMGQARSSGVIAADMNPLGERLPADYSRPLSLVVDEQLLTANSINHLRRGQNVLTGDGTVRFLKTRVLGLQQDDIFAIKGMQCGAQLTGCEQPANPADAFLVP